MIGIQDTSSATYRQLLGNGLSYEIPKFQRDYSWSSEQWDDLWQDIQGLLTGQDDGHYMGYLVLQTTNNKVHQVIDGQQRLTTLSIAILAVLKCLQDLIDAGVDAANNIRRLDSLRSSYIGYLDPVTLIATNKLKLNRNNDDYFKTYLVPLITPPVRNINASEKLMRLCFQWYYERLKRSYTTGEGLAGFVDTMVDKLMFTVLRVGDDMNAFKVFETLNARGVQLSSADLLKNYLFSVVDHEERHASELQEMEKLWASVMSVLGGERFEEFLRTYWNSRRGNVRKSELYKVIRKEVTSKGDAFNLLRDLRRTADIFMALRSPEDELWKGQPLVPAHLAELKLYRVKQPMPLLLSAYESLPPDVFLRVLRACSVISLRYNVIGGLNPNEQDTTYNAVALRVFREKRIDMAWLRAIYPDDESFTAAFANVEFRGTSRSNNIVKYLLATIDRFKHRSSIDQFGEGLTIEHILPVSPDEGWAVDDATLERCVYRLGNLTLLERTKNEDAANTAFALKRPYYQASAIGITKAIAEHYEEWDEARIIKRQKALADVAKEAWRVAL